MDSTIVWERVRSGNTYLSVFLIAVPIAILANYMTAGSVVIKGHAWSTIAPLAFAASSFVLWLIAPRYRRFPPVTYAFLTLLIVSWVVFWLLEKRDGQGLNFTTFLVPILAVMLMIKPVSSRAVALAASTFAWTLVGVFVFSALTDFVSGDSLGGLTIRIPGLSVGALGEGRRWEGPFGSPNYAGPAAAYLVLYAVTNRGWSRRVLLGLGLAFLIITGSRSAIFGTLLGFIVYFIFSDTRRLTRLARPTRLGIAGLILGPLTIISFLTDPSLNGRTPIWPEFWQLWKTSPILGVGTEFIQDRISSGAYPGWFVHAHNMVLDLLGRYGFAGFVVIAAVGVSALLIVGRAADRAVPMGLALVSAFLAIGLVEVHGSWLYWSIPAVWLLIAVLDSSAVSTRERPIERMNNGYAPEAPLRDG